MREVGRVLQCKGEGVHELVEVGRTQSVVATTAVQGQGQRVGRYQGSWEGGMDRWHYPIHDYMYTPLFLLHVLLHGYSWSTVGLLVNFSLTDIYVVLVTAHMQLHIHGYLATKQGCSLIEGSCLRQQSLLESIAVPAASLGSPLSIHILRSLQWLSCSHGHQ